MHIYMFIYTHTYTHTHMYIHMSIYICKHVYFAQGDNLHVVFLRPGNFAKHFCHCVCVCVLVSAYIYIYPLCVCVCVARGSLCMSASESSAPRMLCQVLLPLPPVWCVCVLVSACIQGHCVDQYFRGIIKPDGRR